MNRLIVINDLKRNKMINVTLLLFMVLAVTLAATSAVIGVQTVTSISELYSVARPPHFLQMHKGELDEGSLTSFMTSHPEVTDWQVQTMLGVYGDNLTVDSGDQTISLADSQLDIGLVKQNDIADFLLDSQHQIVTIESGEVGMSNLLRQQYDLAIGDQLTITSNGHTEEFTISEIILDAQMNSPMTSSTRILLSDEDFASFVGRVGEPEYLIEAYFDDSSIASQFQTDYENAGLPNNGPAITYTMMFLLSALTDLLIVFILLLVSFLLIAVSFLCVRFTIMATLQEEVHEIGAMKAIGLTFRDIRSLYLSKYRLLGLIAIVIGFSLAMLLSNGLTNHLSSTFGDMGLSPLPYILAGLMALLVYGLIMFYAKRLLKRIKKATVVDTLVTGTAFNRNERQSHPGLSRNKLPLNWALSFREVGYQFKDWGIVFAISLVTVVMILMPLNLMNTMQSPEFITYMGSSQQDILLEIDSGEQLERNYRQVIDLLSNDQDIANYYEQKRVSVQTYDADGEMANLHIDSGTHSGHGLQYLEGEAPQAEEQIALSTLNADKLGVAVGERISLVNEFGQDYLIVSGIYQDVTNGGYTAKARYEFPDLEATHYQFAIALVNSSIADAKAQAWGDELNSGIGLAPMESFINQTLGGVLVQLQTVVGVIVLIGILLIALVVVLFLHLRLAQDKASIAIQKTIGFTNQDLRKQYLLKMGLSTLLGVFAGVIITNLLGGPLMNGILSLSGLGIRQVTLIPNLLTQFLLVPALILLIVLIVSRINLTRLQHYRIIAIINE